MRYATIKKNDIANGPRVCVSLFMQGCPHHCKNCFNPETWDYNGGVEIELADLCDIICKAIEENGVKRDFNLLGGEPLCEQNIPYTFEILKEIRKTYPNIKIYMWSGYKYEDLLTKNNILISEIFKLADYLVDGPYIDEQRDITLFMRGSRNQRIINLKTREDVTKEFGTIESLS